MNVAGSAPSVIKNALNSFSFCLQKANIVKGKLKKLKKESANTAK